MHPGNINHDQDPLDPLDLVDDSDPNEDSDGMAVVPEDDEDEVDGLAMQMFHHATRATTVILDAAYRALQAHSNAHHEELPYHTSALSGMAWVNELLTGHPDRIRNELGVRRHVFYALFNLLHTVGFRNSRSATLEEQLAIFLYGCVTGLDIVHLGERFQQSNETISKYFKRILNAFSSPPIYPMYVQLPNPASPTPPEITQNPKFYPYFTDAIGAIDGTYITCCPSFGPYHGTSNLEGTSTQFCLAAYSFDMSFICMLSGWAEGSMADAHVDFGARLKGFGIPAGKYYLADDRFASCDELLVPYRGVRYHLSEWSQADAVPCNYKELFNLRHAMLCDVSKGIFGFLKNRFQILLLPPDYIMDVQLRVPSALCFVHNVIRIHDPNDMMDFRDLDFDPGSYDAGALAEGPPSPNEAAQPSHAQTHRDAIAHQMWADYIAERQ